ncbi:hypothetical protein DSL72_001041 [Monilinia vaccinii-corymbosi]|uniref:Uncharacterized protein n=1 Tax=Monilinia vaccinii-corymbosi TaxID=61207 RepID=A0A8A3P6U2_9HELO|nr:hypothetical protein DSL72_001041 [Monilinia vaccinii-corymbosi]
MTSTPHPPNRITITILGDGGVGKSALTLRLVKSQWTSDYDPTIEDSYTVTRRIDGQTFHLHITDTAGQEEYRGMWQSANGSMRSDAFLLVYDITRRESLGALAWFDELVSMEGDVRGEEWMRARKMGASSSSTRSRVKSRLFPPPHAHAAAGCENAYAAPIKIVAGNKCDLQQSREVTASQGLEWARARNCGFMETSARSIVNIEETFALIVRRVVEGRKRLEMWREDGEREREDGDGDGGGDEMVNGVGVGAEGEGEAEEEGDEVGEAEADGREKFGTRRAVTKPLTPLPPEHNLSGENEKRMDGGLGGSAGKRAWRQVSRKLACWS